MYRGSPTSGGEVHFTNHHHHLHPLASRRWRHPRHRHPDQWCCRQSLSVNCQHPRSEEQSYRCTTEGNHGRMQPGGTQPQCHLATCLHRSGMFTCADQQRADVLLWEEWETRWEKWTQQLHSCPFRGESFHACRKCAIDLNEFEKISGKITRCYQISVYRFLADYIKSVFLSVSHGTTHVC